MAADKILMLTQAGIDLELDLPGQGGEFPRMTKIVVCLGPVLDTPEAVRDMTDWPEPWDIDLALGGLRRFGDQSGAALLAHIPADYQLPAGKKITGVGVELVDGTRYAYAPYYQATQGLHKPVGMALTLEVILLLANAQALTVQYEPYDSQAMTDIVVERAWAGIGLTDHLFHLSTNTARLLRERLADLKTHDELRAADCRQKSALHGQADLTHQSIVAVRDANRSGHLALGLSAALSAARMLKERLADLKTHDELRVADCRQKSALHGQADLTHQSIAAVRDANHSGHLTLGLSAALSAARLLRERLADLQAIQKLQSTGRRLSSRIAGLHDLVVSQDVTDRDERYRLISGNTTARAMARHLFVSGADLRLPTGYEGQWVVVALRPGLNLNAVPCRILPPPGATIMTAQGVTSEGINVTSTHIILQFVFAEGRWSV